MATNKNQHYVPRCHLRPFTLNAEGLSISLINIDRKKLITNAPVKYQCSGDYFYGQDEKLEAAIQHLESGYGMALKELLINSSSFSNYSKTALKSFWLFQHLRTEAAAKRAVEFAEETRELAEASPEAFSFGIKEAVQSACRAFVNVMHGIDDLKFCIIKNRTSVPFITSDNPAVLTNKWRLVNDRSPGRSFGLGSAGLLAILPLTERLLFLGYDGDVYSVPNQRGVVEIRNARDAIALNRHQYLQCAANVYIHDPSRSAELIEHYSEIAHARPESSHVIHYAELEGTIGNHERYVVVPREKLSKAKEAIMHMQVVHANPEIWPSQIQIRRNGSVYTNGTGLGYVRLARATMPSTRDFWRERP